MIYGIITKLQCSARKPTKACFTTKEFVIRLILSGRLSGIRSELLKKIANLQQTCVVCKLQS